MESFPHNYSPEKTPDTPELGAIRNRAQIALALFASKEAHPDLDEQELKALAMKEWIGDPDDPHSLAAQFSDYVEDEAHAHEHVNLEDPSELAKLLEEVRHYGGESIH